MEEFNINYCACRAGHLDYYINETTISWKENPLYDPFDPFNP